MKRSVRWCIAVFTVALLAHFNSAEAKALRIALPPKPAMQAVQAQVIVLGKVIEIEKETVEVTLFKGAPKDQKTSFKIAVVKIEDPLVGARGLTQLRVGFQADAAPVTAVPLPAGNQAPAIAIARRPFPGGAGPIALTAGQEGVFMLNQHHEGDFYVLVNNGQPLLKKTEGYDKELEAIKKIALAIDEPITALKAKDKNDRGLAAHTILTRLRSVPVGATKVVEEEIPAELNTLLVQAIAELPWSPEGGDFNKPSRSAVWFMLQPEKYGFKNPEFKPQPGVPQLSTPVDFNKKWEESTTAFLKENAEKIKIKKFVAGK